MKRINQIFVQSLPSWVIFISFIRVGIRYEFIYVIFIYEKLLIQDFNDFFDHLHTYERGCITAEPILAAQPSTSGGRWSRPFRIVATIFYNLTDFTSNSQRCRSSSIFLNAPMNINTKAAVIYADQREYEWREKGTKKKKKKKNERKKGRKDDSILPVPFYVAVSVYAPDFSTYPRAFEIPPCWELTNFYDPPHLPSAPPPPALLFLAEFSAHIIFDSLTNETL